MLPRLSVRCCGLLLAMAGAIGGAPASAQVIYGPAGPYRGVYPYPGTFGCSPHPCPLPGETRQDLRREFRQEELRQQSTPRPQSFELPRTPPVPTRAEEIRPEYQGASQIRDEYRRSGDTR